MAAAPCNTPTDFPKAARRVSFLGCPMDLMTSREFLDQVVAAVDGGQPAKVVQFVNANKVAKVHGDHQLGRILWRADYVLTDGQPLLPMARCLGIRVPERIDGIGLMGQMLQLADQHGYSVYLLGARQEVVEACAERIRSQYPRLRIAGLRNGYFAMAEAEAVAAEVAATSPDLLFLGLGSPQKELLAERCRHQFHARVIQGVGGSFDVMAGLVRRAPRWMQAMGLEWLFRVCQEPRRMFWRYATTNTLCLWLFARALFRRLTGRTPCPRPSWLQAETG